MEKSRKVSAFSIIMTLITAVFTGFIFFHSCLNADASDGESIALLNIINRFFNSMGIPLEFSNFIVRKLAHFSEFGVLAVLLTVTFYSYGNFPLKKTPQILFVCLFCACIDETIQIFTPGRASLVTDIWVDFCGSVTALILTSIVIAIIEKHKRKKLLKSAAD
ncbi:MAG: VanZ family protein [bacterium]|nr:VanZ family protein [bacterium]MDY3860990.1 VanZ family protein [Ruminococcus sp.]